MEYFAVAATLRYFLLPLDFTLHESHIGIFDTFIYSAGQPLSVWGSCRLGFTQETVSFCVIYTAATHVTIYLKDFIILWFCFYFLAAMHTFTHLMACLSTSWQYLCREVGNIHPRITMTCASFVQMVGILCFVMDAQGLSTEVKFMILTI